MPDDSIPNPTPTPPPAPRRPETDDELRRVLGNLATKVGGDTDKVAMRLIRMNNDLGAKLAAAEARAVAAEDRTKAAVPEGHVAVPKADADALAAFKAIGPDPAKLKESLAQLDAYRPLGEPAAIRSSLDRLPVVEKTIAAHEREKQLASVAQVAGYAPAVLARLAPEGMTFVAARGKLHGKDVDTFDVVDADPATGKERRRPLNEVEESDWKDMLPALKPPAAADDVRRPLPRGASPYRGEARLTRADEENRRERLPRAAEENRQLARGVAMGI